MNKQIKQKWVAALLSGDYIQGVGQLANADGDRHCCLGVLGDVLGRTTKQMSGRSFIADKVIPKSIQKRLAELNDCENGLVVFPDGSHFNPYEGVPFEMIAGLIDQAL